MAFVAGSIAFVAYSFDNFNAGLGNQQGFAFVALAPIAAGDRIRFVDGGMGNNGTLSVDSQVVWTNTTGVAIPAGSIIQVTFTGYSGAESSDTGGFTLASTNLGSVSAPTASNGTAPALWNVDTTDSLYAVTSLSGTAATTTVAAVLWGDTTTRNITSGASVLDPAGAASTATDTAVINAATANASYADAAAARAAYTNPANWIADDDSSDDAGTGTAPDWPPLTDSNSPLNGRTALTVAPPAFSFGDADRLINKAESTATPVTISGLGTGATAVVTFRSSGGAATVTATFTANGATGVNLSGLADGAVTITNVAVTNSGATTNYANPPTGNPATLDATPPAAPTIGAVADNAGSIQGNLASGGTTDDATLALTGTAAAGSTVEILNGAAVLGTATANGSGAWAYTTPALSGAVSLTARATDAAGNQASSAAFTATIDTAAPNAPAISGVTDNTGTVQGAVAAGAATDDATPTIRGTAEANSTVAVFDGAALLGTAAADASGAWSFTPGAALAQGAHGFTARATDAAGNQGAASAAYAVVVDTAAPAAPVITGVFDDRAPGTGAVADGGATNDATPTIRGTAEAGATVGIYAGSFLAGSTTADANGDWSYTPAAAVADGAYVVTARATDAAGNQSAASAAFAATVDTAPDADVAVDLLDAEASPGGASVSFGLSGLDAGSSATVTLTGSAGGSVTRTYAANGAQTADVSGLLGDVTAAVLVTDRAGNQAAGAGDTLAADPVCFYPGTLVAVPGGEAAVETLRAGDLVLTAGGEAKPVRWLGRQTVSTRFADPLRVLPVRIAAGALGENLPRRDLLVSPDHAILVDGVLAQAGALVNGTTVRREAAVPEVFAYWHVELADHALVLAEGVAAETFIDNVARAAFDNWAGHEAAGAPPAPLAEMALPRAKSARQVPAATRRRLAERAAALLGSAVAAA